MAELLKLTHGTGDVATRKRAGHLLLQLGSPDEAAVVFEGLLREDPQDGEAEAGLGDAEFAAGDYAAAARAFRAVRQLEPNDHASAERLELCERILALDPTLPGLTAAERYERSRNILEGALGEFAQCVALDRTRPAPASAAGLMTAARTTLLSRTRPRSYESATVTNLSLARQLSATRMVLCGSKSGGDEALELVLTRIANRQ